MEVVLISTPNDLRFFDGENYTALDIFNSIKNVNIIPYDKDGFISFNDCVIDINNNLIKISGKELEIPSAIQFDDNDEKVGLFVNRINDNKFTILPNKYSPKHVTYEINDIDDFRKIENKKNFIHLIINNELVNSNKSLINMELFKINPTSVKYKDEKKEKNIKLVDNFDIRSKIYDAIGNNEKLKTQFDRILDINKRNL
jgi:hypothetical protein